MRQHLDSIYEAVPGHDPGRRNARRNYKVSKNRPQSRRSAPAGAGMDYLHNSGRKSVKPLIGAFKLIDKHLLCGYNLLKY